eukprot:1176829-Prorocentrum_minimum.AAC.2
MFLIGKRKTNAGPGGLMLISNPTSVPLMVRTATTASKKKKMHRSTFVRIVQYRYVDAQCELSNEGVPKQFVELQHDGRFLSSGLINN